MIKIEKKTKEQSEMIVNVDYKAIECLYNSIDKKQQFKESLKYAYFDKEKQSLVATNGKAMVIYKPSAKLLEQIGKEEHNTFFNIEKQGSIYLLEGVSCDEDYLKYRLAVISDTENATMKNKTINCKGISDKYRKQFILQQVAIHTQSMINPCFAESIDDTKRYLVYGFGDNKPIVLVSSDNTTTVVLMPLSK